jgi:hypothetical protein
MYAVSNYQREEIIKLLTAIQDLPGKDTKTINTKRRAGIMIKKLIHSKQISYEKLIKHQ